MKKIIAFFFFFLAFKMGIAFWEWKIIASRPKEKKANNFEECASAGYPVLESYPRQCKTPSGKMFFEIIQEK